MFNICEQEKFHAQFSWKSLITPGPGYPIKNKIDSYQTLWELIGYDEWIICLNWRNLKILPELFAFS